MYYSSESSDDDMAALGVDNGSSSSMKGLDFSYLMLDAESLSVHLRNSIREQSVKEKANSRKVSKEDQPLDGIPISSGQNEMGTNARQPFYETHTNNDLESSNAIRVRPNTNPRLKATFCDIDDDDDEGSASGHDLVTNKLYLQHNMLLTLPFEIVRFSKLKFLDLSNNSLTHINDFLLQLPELQTLYIKNNDLNDDGLPKDLSLMTKLREVNLSGNRFTRVPNQFYEMNSLRYLYLGNNEITEILPEVKSMQSLNVLHLGGNMLENVPDELGELYQLQALVLCENRLRRLPRSIANLTRLRSLLLHKNNLCCLPVGIVKLRGLLELSLRDNPLVTKFINCCAKELMYNPPSLLELAARVIRLKKLQYTEEDLPKSLISYLCSGQRCVNPKCKGMFFTSCVEHIKFVDFCGVYRVPLMHYLCSSRCSSKTPAYYRAISSESESDDERPLDTMKKVLLPDLPL